MKRWSLSLNIHIKATVKYHFTLTRMTIANTQSRKITGLERDLKKSGNLFC